MSNLETNQNSNKVFLSIVQGSLRQSVTEGTPNAVKRDWEAGGEKGTKWEIPFRAISGNITDIQFYEGESNGRKFKTLNIVLDETPEGKIPVITTGLSTRYATDLLKKLPSIDLKGEVRFRPFSFIPDGEEKEVIGMEVMQRDPVTGNFEKKIYSHFHKKDGDKWTSINGYPIPEEGLDSDGWKIFYMQATRFMSSYIQNNVLPKLQKDGFSYPEETIRAEDIPFD